MAKYIVKTPLNHDGKDYAPGDTVEMSPKAAVQIPWCVASEAQLREEAKAAVMPWLKDSKDETPPTGGAAG